MIRGAVSQAVKSAVASGVCQVRDAQAPAPVDPTFLLMEDGTSKLLLEDGGMIVLE